MKYRKKPVVIEAVQYFNGDGPNTVQQCVDFVGSNCFMNEDNLFVIKTLEGDMVALDGDYIIKGIKGEVYPCKPDIFEQTYEKVES